MDGAGLTFPGVAAFGVARDPPHDAPPVIHEGESGREVLILPPAAHQRPATDRVFLVRRDNPEQAYQTIIGRDPVTLNHHAPGWGEIYMGIVLPRARTQQGREQVLAFQAPSIEKVQYVAIKRLNRRVVDAYLALGGHENPYNEIARMQAIGDNLHVIECTEALHDEHFLYIVTPYSHEGSLLSGCMEVNEAGERGYEEDQARELFRNIIEILLYLEDKGIHHHDISPDNFLFFNGRLVLFDFAMSMRIPKDNNDPPGKRYLIKHQGKFGTLACQAPEVYQENYRENTPREDMPFDGIAADLWSCVMTLYIMLTGRHLYDLPQIADVGFQYFIHFGGLSSFNANERVVEHFAGEDEEHNPFLARAQANLFIPADAMEIMKNVLRCDPNERWSLRQVCTSPWLQQIG